MVVASQTINWHVSTPTQPMTAMPLPHVGPEVIDQIIDNLSDDINALNDCSLICKSWVPHTRGHLFCRANCDCNADLQWWKSLFPNTVHFRGCYTRILCVIAAHIITMTTIRPGCEKVGVSYLLVLNWSYNRAWLVAAMFGGGPTCWGREEGKLSVGGSFFSHFSLGSSSRLTQS